MHYESIRQLTDAGQVEARLVTRVRQRPGMLTPRQPEVWRPHRFLLLHVRPIVDGPYKTPGVPAATTDYARLAYHQLQNAEDYDILRRRCRRQPCQVKQQTTACKHPRCAMPQMLCTFSQDRHCAACTLVALRCDMFSQSAAAEGAGTFCRPETVGGCLPGD